MGGSIVMVSSAVIGACPGMPMGFGIGSRWSGVWVACRMASCAWYIGSRNDCPDMDGCGREGTTEGIVGAGWAGVGGATGGVLNGGVHMVSELDGP